MLHLDAIAHTSKVRHFYPQLRLTLTLILLIISLSVDSNVLYLAALCFSVIFMLTATSIKPSQLLKLYFIPLIFVVSSCILILVEISQNTPEASVIIGSIYKINFYISLDSINRSLNTFLRSISGISMVFSISTTIPMNEFIIWLKKIRLPDEFIELYVLTYRFIFILIEEASDMILASDLRFSYLKPHLAINNLGMMIYSLFYKTIKRYEDLCQALSLRQF